MPVRDVLMNEFDKSVLVISLRQERISQKCSKTINTTVIFIVVIMFNVENITRPLPGP